MIDKTIITRADDCASSLSTNAGIQKAVSGGLIKNVSVMGNCRYLDDAAGLFAGRKDICFGMHATLNAEWSKVKWGSAAPPDLVPSLLDAQGFLHPNPAVFRTHHPNPEEVLREYDAQLDAITRAGFRVSYVDSHMFAEACIEGIPEQIQEWIRKKGLIDHSVFYRELPKVPDATRSTASFENLLRTLGAGQYVLIFHPCEMSPESLMMGNDSEDGAEVAACRDDEMRLCADPNARALMEKYGFQAIRYDEAEASVGPKGLNAKDEKRD